MGDNVAWVPGYWAWEGEQNDFIWISGIWRNLPPGRQWVPGYWAQADAQWQWTSGYWADENTQEVTYLPRPPKSIESGPNVKAPSKNDIWISGNWIRREERYAWTPGYWEPAQSDWSWIPSHYQWTRRGYVFNDGYWDYSVARRGVMFAPVRFSGDGYRRPGYTYTPLLVVSLNVLVDHLFIRPSYGHYYFGDYYSPRYRDNGYYASYSYSSRYRGYDPIFAHSRWENRDDRDWELSRRDDFNYYRDNEDSRPDRTWAALQARPNKNDNDERQQYAFAQPLSTYVEQADSGRKFQSVDKKSRDNFVEERNKIREFGKERRQVESRPSEKSGDETDKGGQVITEKIARSPLVARSAEQLSGKDVPPKRLSRRDPQPDVDGKPSEQTQETDKPGKIPSGETDLPGNAKRGDNQRERNTKENGTPREKDAQRSDPLAEPKKSPKTEAPIPSRKSDENNPPPKRVTQPEDNQKMKPRSQPEPSAPERRKADEPTEPKAEPKTRQRVEPAPEPRPEAQPKRQAEPKPERQQERKPEVQPKRQAEPKPERQQERKPEAQPKRQAEPKPERQQERQPEPSRQARPDKQSGQPSEKTSGQNDSKEESSGDAGKGSKR